jgi:predicted PurR-regulated permease PerM
MPALESHDSVAAEVTRADAQARPLLIAPRTIWLITGIVVALAVSTYVLVQARDVLILLFVAIIFAEGIRPLVNWQRGKGVPRALSVLVIYLVTLAALIALAWLLLQPLTAQLVSLLHHLPADAARLQQQLRQFQQLAGSNSFVGGLLDTLKSQAGAAVGVVGPALLSGPLGVVTFLFDTILVLVVTFMWLTATDGLRPFVVGLFPEHTQPVVASILAEMGQRIGGYLRGVVFSMVVIGVISGAGLFVLGVPYPLLLGIFAGLTEAIPIIGPFIGGAVAVLVALAAEGPLKAGETALLYVLIQQLEGNTLVPLVMHRVVHLNPLTVLVAVLFGTALFGIVGAVLAVPLAVVVQVLVERVLAPTARHASARAHEDPEDHRDRERHVGPHGPDAQGDQEQQREGQGEDVGQIGEERQEGQEGQLQHEDHAERLGALGPGAAPSAP